ncbi:hypothetical protein GCM10020256_04990 [Streptomyces thermocoprophilus]
MSKLARALEADGLLERTRDPDDPRAVRLALTERGRETTRQAIEVVQRLMAVWLAPLGGPDSARTREFTATLATLLDTPLGLPAEPSGKRRPVRTACHRGAVMTGTAPPPHRTPPTTPRRPPTAAVSPSPTTPPAPSWRACWPATASPSRRTPRSSSSSGPTAPPDATRSPPPSPAR